MQMYIHYAHICTHILTYTYTYMPIYSLLSYRLFLWAQSECYKLQTILFLLISFSTAFGSPSSYICSRHNEQCCDVWTLFCHLSGLGMTGCTHSCPQNTVLLSPAHWRHVHTENSCCALAENTKSWPVVPPWRDCTGPHCTVVVPARQHWMGTGTGPCVVTGNLWSPQPSAAMLPLCPLLPESCQINASFSFCVVNC